MFRYNVVTHYIANLKEVPMRRCRPVTVKRKGILKDRSMQKTKGPIEFIDINLDKLSKREGTYFIRSGKYIKIGRAKNIAIRLANHQVSHPEPIELIAVEKDPENEYFFHWLFREFRYSGEWFKMDAEYMFDIIDCLNSYGQRR